MLYFKALAVFKLYLQRKQSFHNREFLQNLTKLIAKHKKMIICQKYLSDLNFNQKFDYEFGRQGTTTFVHAHV